MKFITRFAPSPSGSLHIGGARTALFNYLAARASNGSFLLRIDDTDLARSKKEYINIIIDSLDWLGLTFDVYFKQSERITIYQKIAFDLIKANLAKELKNGAIALNTTSISLPESFTDTIGGSIPITETNKAQIFQVILLRGTSDVLSNQLHQPTYQFASVVDDYLMGVNWIIRGVDHLTNTPKQIAIWNSLRVLNGEHEDEAIRQPLPQFTHIGLIHHNGKKLSKRDNAASLLWYKEQGYSPLAILNLLFRLGWGSAKDNNKLLTLEQMAELFFEGTMKSSPSNFTEHQLKYYQKQTLRTAL